MGRKLQEEFHKKQLEMLQNVGKVRGEEADRMKQILDCLGNEVAQKRAGVHPNQEDENPDWTEDESAVASAPWIQAKSKGSKSSPTQLKKAQQPHRQPQRSQQDIQRQQQLQLQQQRAELRKQAEEKKQKEREEAQEKAREEERRGEERREEKKRREEKRREDPC